MAFMTWNQHFVTGIKVVDQQHQTLVDMINEAAPALAAARRETLSGIDLAPLIERLTDYAGTHFSTEESLMEKQGLDLRHFAHHRQSHAAFVRQVTAMSRSLLDGGAVTGDELLTFLANWLIFHILGEDQAMARQVRALTAGQTSGQAFKEGGAQRAPEPQVLTRLLVDLYTLLSEQNRSLFEMTLRLQDLQARLAQVEAQN